MLGSFLSVVFSRLEINAEVSTPPRRGSSRTTKTSLLSSQAKSRDSSAASEPRSGLGRNDKKKRLSPAAREKLRDAAFGRSRCDHCHTAIAWYDNVPLISYVLLRGRCRHCGKSISHYHPFLELSLALYLVVAYLGYDLEFQFFVAAIFGLFLILIFAYDLKHQLIPNAFVVPAILLALLLIVAQYVLGFQHSPVNLLLWSSNPTSYVIGGLAGGLFFLALSLISGGRWIGGGDIKLGFLLGLLLGWPYILVALIGAYLIGTLYAVILVATKHAKLSSMVPFGPMLVFGFFIAEYYGDVVIRWYQGWFL